MEYLRDFRAYEFWNWIAWIEYQGQDILSSFISFLLFLKDELEKARDHYTFWLLVKSKYIWFHDDFLRIFEMFELEIYLNTSS